MPFNNPNDKNKNKFWLGSKPVANRAWTADSLYEACCEYFNWAHDNPLYESKAFAYKGDSWIEPIDKARVFTAQGLCNFIGISKREWIALLAMDDLKHICEWAEQIIYQQKFELASADLINAGLIARDLGLSDRKELGGIVGQPLEISARDQLIDRLAGFIAEEETDGVPAQPE